VSAWARQAVSDSRGGRDAQTAGGSGRRFLRGPRGGGEAAQGIGPARRAGTARRVEREAVVGAAATHRAVAGGAGGDVTSAIGGGFATTTSADRAGAHRLAGSATSARERGERPRVGGLDAPGAGGPGVSAVAAPRDQGGKAAMAAARRTGSASMASSRARA